MARLLSQRIASTAACFISRKAIARIALGLAALLALTLPLAAQAPTGPIKPPPAAPGASQPASAPAPANPPRARESAPSPLTSEPPSIPVDQIIQQFAAREAEFKRERDNFTYTQTFSIQTINDDGIPDGEHRVVSDIVFTPDGKRFEKITYAPQPTLTRISLEQHDWDDLRNITPFVLTSDELPKYDVKYVGRQQVDELHTYVFDIAPKTIEKNQRYFQGRIWVDDKDLQIVKTFGKAVPDIVKKNSESLSPKFATYRENIEGHYWFPTYTRADDELRFRSGPVHIRMTVRYANYKRYRVSIKFGEATEIKQEHQP